MANYKTIHEAAARGDLDDVKRHLQNGADVNARSEDDTTPLMTAAQNDHLEVAKYLLARDWGRVSTYNIYPSCHQIPF